MVFPFPLNIIDLDVSEIPDGALVAATRLTVPFCGLQKQVRITIPLVFAEGATNCATPLGAMVAKFFPMGTAFIVAFVKWCFLFNKHHDNKSQVSAMAPGPEFATQSPIPAGIYSGYGITTSLFEPAAEFPLPEKMIG